ncbi:MAG: NosD domain-containing protein [Halobacteriaceae archaeon]
MSVEYALPVVLAALLVAAGAFAVAPASGRSFDPAPWTKTVRTGMTGVDVKAAAAAGRAIPRAQVFFAQYRYPVGYYGVDAAAAAVDDPDRRRQFGRPLAVFVTDFGGTDPTLTADGFVDADRTAVGWVRAPAAHFVVDGRARTPVGPAVVPFGTREAAAAFAEATGGRVVDWATVRAAYARDDPTGDFSAAVSARRRWANRSAAGARALLERPVSVTVGDGTTLAAAVARAPPNTTVRVPAGTYRNVSLTVDTPVSLVGAGPETRLVGDGHGSVVRANASRVAVAHLAVSGSGPNGTTPNWTAKQARSDAWDRTISTAYGHGDAALEFGAANGSLVRDVRVRTRANGVLVRDSEGFVVDGLVVNGTDRWQDGFMGVLAMRSRVVVQRSAFRGGRDGVYTHRSHGSVVRDNVMTDQRFGVHLMYTSRTLLADNRVRGDDIGLVVMTRPTRNVLVGNDVRDSHTGLSASGTASLVARNALAGNHLGLTVSSERSVYRQNVVAGNDVGVRTDTILPTNRVVANDVVANEVPVAKSGGPLRVWSADGRGNYWGPLPLRDADGDGTLDRPYHPTGTLDARIVRSPAAASLARSPAMALVRSLSTTVPGLRQRGVVDESPRATPVRPAALAAFGRGNASDSPGAAPAAGGGP